MKSGQMRHIGKPPPARGIPAIVPIIGVVSMKHKISAIFLACISAFLLCGVDGAFAVEVKVASIQYRSIPHDKAANIRNLLNLVDEASANGARIIVLPEMSTTGLNIKDEKEAAALAETIPGPTTKAFAKLAKRYRAYIVFGMPEFDASAKKYYSSQVLLGPDGSVAGKYRKIHLYGPDLNWSSRGDLGFKVIATEWGRIGMGICYDINFQDILDFLSANNAGILAFSTNWIGSEQPFKRWTTLLKDRRLYFIAANNWGADGKFTGGSIIMSPELTTLSSLDAPRDAILYAIIKSAGYKQ